MWDLSGTAFDSSRRESCWPLFHSPACLNSFCKVMQSLLAKCCIIMGQEEDSVLLQTCTWNLEVKISVQIKFVKQNSIWQFDISVKYDYWPRGFFIFSGGIMYSPLCCSKKIVFTVFFMKRHWCFYSARTHEFDQKWQWRHLECLTKDFYFKYFKFFWPLWKYIFPNICLYVFIYVSKKNY